MTKNHISKQTARNITKPEPIQHHHILDNFECKQESLTFFLKKRAIKNDLNGASRTYVTTDGSNDVIAYFTLAVGSIEHKDVRGKVRRNMPDPIPVTVLGRLAVDKKWEGKGIGAGLLKEAIMKTLEISEVVGIKAMLVHAISEEAKQFYIKHGFEQSPTDDMTLIITVDDVRKAVLS